MAQHMPAVDGALAIGTLDATALKLGLDHLPKDRLIRLGQHQTHAAAGRGGQPDDHRLRLVIIVGRPANGFGRRAGARLPNPPRGVFAGNEKC